MHRERKLSVLTLSQKGKRTGRIVSPTLGRETEAFGLTYLSANNSHWKIIVLGFVLMSINALLPHYQWNQIWIPVV